MDFSGKIILVTGGSSGLGLSTIINYINHGAEKIYTCGRNLCKWKISLILLKKKLGNKYKNIQFIQTDIRIENEVKNLIKSIFDQSGQLDIVVNNAGVNIPPVDIWEQNFGITYKEHNIIKYNFYDGDGNGNSYESPLFTNLYGLHFCLKWELKYILKYNNPCKQVNILNIASIFEVPYYATYLSSKAGIIELTKSVAGQVALRKFYNNDITPTILINSLSPGAMTTPLYFDNFNIPVELAVENTKSINPLNRISPPKEISKYVLILTDSNLTTFTNGSNIIVDGGASAIPNYNRSN